MPFSDWMEFYTDEDFWKLVGLMRKLIPLPQTHPNETYVCMSKTGVIIRFRKFSFFYNTSSDNLLAGIRTIDSIWMFDTLLEPGQEGEVDKIF